MIERLSTNELQRIAAGLSPASLAHYASRGRWEYARHLDVLDAYLQSVIFGDLQRLMVFMPPRHGKSELISKYTPVCFIGNWPERRVILVSYEADFAAQWGWKARAVMEEFGGELYKLALDSSSSARDRWDIAGHYGGMNTAGAGGPITGKGADLLIIDDPVKNDEEANSKVYREKLWNWYQSTAQTRVEPGGHTILIMTRWHEDDLAGRLLADQPGAWTVLSLPALAESNDALGRECGDALWPERWPVELLEERRRSAGSHYWEAMYQQRPSPAEGAIFKREWFRYYENSKGTYKLWPTGDYSHAPEIMQVEDCWIFTTVDLAASVKTEADYTVISTWAVTPKQQLILLDRQRLHMEGPDQVPRIRSVYDRWQPSFICIEKVGYQLALIQSARRDGLPITEGQIDKDKVSRALVAAARLEGGDVFFPRGAAWLSEWESELLGFPRAKHDDQVDTLSAAVAEVARRGMVRFG